MKNLSIITRTLLTLTGFPTLSGLLFGSFIIEEAFEKPSSKFPPVLVEGLGRSKMRVFQRSPEINVSLTETAPSPQSSHNGDSTRSAACI
jgi:hypothetical protein